MRSILGIFIFFFSLSANAQYLHTPEEMLRIVDDSSLRYIIDTLEQTKSNSSSPIIQKGWFAKPISEGIQLDLNEGIKNRKANQDYKKAMQYYERQNYNKTITWAKKAMKSAPSNIEIMKRIGRSYGATGALETAAYWYEMVLEINYIDFEAHFLLANIFHELVRRDGSGEKEKAIKHITLAHILNRNQTDILNSLKEIYNSVGINYKEWQFNPQYTISKQDNQEIHIAYKDSPWLAYGTCKAVWEYEPGYKEKMKNISSAPQLITEEKECLLNALIAYENMEGDKSQFPEFEMLALALKNRTVDDFILYEILSPKQPLEISKLPKEKLEKLANYVSSLRSGFQ